MVQWQNHVSHRIDKLSLQQPEPLDAQGPPKLPWQPKMARISDEAVHAMSMAQLGDWIT